MDPCTVLYGFTPGNADNALVNHVLLIYKQVLFYNREKGNETNLMSFFLTKLKNTRNIELIIAKKRNKLYTHYKKWRPISDGLL
jgi:hypothetical protein